MKSAIGRGAALVVAAGVLAADAAAQEGAPPLREMGERFDQAKLVSLQLPVNAQQTVLAEPDPDLLGAWGIDLNAQPSKPQIYVYAFQRPGGIRAGLAAASDRADLKWGAVIPETIAAKPGECSEDRVTNVATFSFRYLESAGGVFCVAAQCTTPLHPRLKEHLATLVAGFKVVGSMPKMTPPAGYRTANVDGRELWTDSKRDICDRVLKYHAQAWDLMKKVLPGPLLFTEPPRVIVCDTTAGYEALVGTGKGIFVTSSNRLRALVVRADVYKDSDFAPAVQRAAAIQYVRAYFGGRVPEWIESGLRMYCQLALVENGHFELPAKTYAQGARAGAAEGRWTLASLFTLQRFEEPKRTGFDHLVWAWHWYFRLGPDAAGSGAVYAAELQRLRETGDIAEAHKAWDGVDVGKVQAAFDTWLATWRK